MSRVLGIDSSTQGVAWCLTIDSQPSKWGLIQLNKTTGMNNKLKKIADEFPLILSQTKPDHIFIEKVIFVRSAATARVLAYVVGCLMTLCLQQDMVYEDVDILSWKSMTGYTKLTRKFSTTAAKKLGRIAGKKLCEEMRKSQTQRVLIYNFPDFDGVVDNNISDACAISLYGANQLGETIVLKKSKEIALDLPKLEALGLGGIL